MRRIATSRYRTADDWCETLELFYTDEDTPYYLLCDPGLDEPEEKFEFYGSENDRVYIMTVNFDHETRRIKGFECTCETDRSQGCFARPVTFERSVRPDEQKRFLAYLEPRVTTDVQKVTESKTAQAAAAEARHRAKAEKEAADRRKMEEKARAEAAQREAENAERRERYRSEPEKVKAELLDKLTQGIFDGKRRLVAPYVESALELGIPRADIREAVIKGGTMLTDAMSRGEIWITDVLVGLRAMKAAESILKADARPLVLGFPGAFHNYPDTQRNYDMASAILGASGFSVTDLENNDDPGTYVNAVSEYKPVAVILVKHMCGASVASAGERWQSVYDAVTACVQDGSPEVLVMDDSDTEHSFSQLQSVIALGRMLAQKYVC